MLSLNICIGNEKRRRIGFKMEFSSFLLGGESDTGLHIHKLMSRNGAQNNTISTFK
jgi:hypothetical protein